MMEGDKQRPAQKITGKALQYEPLNNIITLVLTTSSVKLVIRAQYSNLNDHLGQSLFFKNNNGIWS